MVEEPGPSSAGGPGRAGPPPQENSLWPGRRRRGKKPPPPQLGGSVAATPVRTAGLVTLWPPWPGEETACGGKKGAPRAHAGPGGQRASPPNWPGPPSDLELSVALGPWKGVGVTVAACASTFGSLLWPEGLGGGFASHPLSAPLGADVTTPRVTERGRGRHGAPLGSHPPCPPCAWASPC